MVEFTAEEKKKPWVLLRGIEWGNSFIISNIEGNDPTLSSKGETWYTIIGYADTVAEAQTKLYGRSYE